MSYPYEISGTIDILSDTINEQKVSESLLLRVLTQNFSDKPDFNVQQNKVTYTETDTLFKIPYGIQIFVTKKGSDYTLNYSIEYDKLIKITLALTILSAFLSFYSVTTFLITAAIFSVMFYIGNSFFIQSSFERRLNGIVGNTEVEFENGGIVTAELKKRLNNPNLCPACGADIHTYDLECSECGLRLRQNRYSRPLDISKYQSAHVNYEYKPKA